MKRTIMLLLLPMLIITQFGCTKSNYGPKITQVQYYPACYRPIEELRSSDDQTTKSTAIGAVGGAIIGGLIGAATTGSTKGALVGAGIGAVGGGLLGYAKAKQDAIHDAKARYASYVGDIKDEAGKLDQVTLAGKAARACYEQSFDSLVAQYKSKQISREEYKNRYTEIRNGMMEAAQILGQAYESGTEKDKQFQAALESEAQAAGTSADQVKKKQAAAQKAQQAPSKKKKSATKPPVSAAPAPEGTDSLAGLDEQSLEAVSANANHYGVAVDGVRLEQVAVTAQIQRMDTVDASLGNEVI